MVYFTYVSNVNHVYLLMWIFNSCCCLNVGNYTGFEGNCGDMKVYLTWTGSDKRFKVNNVATTASTLSCYASLTTFPAVDLVISAGTCGGFQQAGGHIADVQLQIFVWKFYVAYAVACLLRIIHRLLSTRKQ